MCVCVYLYTYIYIYIYIIVCFCLKVQVFAYIIRPTLQALGSHVLCTRLPREDSRIILSFINARPMKAAKIRTVPIHMHGEWKNLIVMKTRDLTLGMFLWVDTDHGVIHHTCHCCSFLPLAVVGPINLNYARISSMLDEFELSLQYVGLGIPSEVYQITCLCCTFRCVEPSPSS